MDAVFHLQGVAVFSVLVHGVGEGDLEVGITGLQRLIGPGDILCHIAGHAVGVVGRYLHTGGVEGVFYIVGRLVRQLRDLDAFNGAAHGHQVGGVVFKVDGAVLIHDGATDGVLRLCAAGGEDVVGRRIGLRFSAGGIGLHGFQRNLGLTGLVLQHPEFAGGEVIEEIHIDAACLLHIGSGQNTAGLGIAMGAHSVGDLPVGDVDDRKVMATVCAELCRAGDADIGPPIVNGGCAGGHGGIGGIVRIVVELQGADILNGTLFVHSGLVEVAALAGEVILAVVMGDRAADVAGHIHLVGGQQFAGLGIKGQQTGLAGGVAGSAVIRADQQEVVAHIGTGPIEAALAGVVPSGELFFHRLRGVLVGGAQAHIVGLVDLAHPKTGVDVAIVIDNRAVGLTADGVPIDP